MNEDGSGTKMNWAMAVALKGVPDVLFGLAATTRTSAVD
jgi:hypothetical protein